MPQTKKNRKDPSVRALQKFRDLPESSGRKQDEKWESTWYSEFQSVRLVAMDEAAGYKIRPGLYGVNGALPLRGGVNFTVHSSGATGVTLLLFRREARKPYAKIPFPKHYRIGHVWSMLVFGLDIEEFEYAYSLDGPWDPKEGLRFDPGNILLDPYARAVTGQSVWGVKNDQFYKARVVRNDFDWGKETRPLIPMEDLVIYELHVRGFTRHASSWVDHPGTFLGLMEKIPYLKALGVNAVELMPVFEFDETAEMREYGGKPLFNYWGYSTVSFFAPNTSYSAEKEFNREGDEMKRLIRELHRNGIECILDVVLNHTAEGGEAGPVFSFKGFDNQIYYLLTPEGDYYNFSGCGNTMNCNHPVVQDLILDCLRYWTTAYHVDGFRFDLASILGRDEEGNPMKNPPLLERLACDPVLGDTKLIAEAWDAAGLYQIGGFTYRGRWAEWNGRYRDELRDFLKGDFGLWRSAAERITGSRDIYHPEVRGRNASVNFITCHDGFTLNDLYSYSRKHNEENGWDNTDGTDDNRSWNCGVEGETEDPEVLALRRKLCRNALAVLIFSRGTPMLLAGDEFLNSQGGNNNAYCQDNETSWLNWDELLKNRAFALFVQQLIHFRRMHPVLRKPWGTCSFGLPELLVLEPAVGSRAMGIVYAGRNEKQTADDCIALLINVYWEEQWVGLPPVPRGKTWRVEADTSEEDGGIQRGRKKARSFDGGVLLKPRSVMVLSMQESD